MNPPSPVSNPASATGMFTYEEAQANAHLFMAGYTYYWDASSATYMPQSQAGTTQLPGLGITLPGVQAPATGSNASHWRRHRRQS